ncbi:hypothetical protein T4B_6158 [Trichinella pseudospiralis]|uniref:Uncharacterized protein n=1 Tax=Trichinella pseudospiralis TaxID=6337 RepID=A0A0V1K209_TRIPS|nr:hypothetical protein T4B_6158 [Trichinella pseudospiralis]KRZ41264.1 hypothetical protein T4C_11653 [Trichinella pseudospiralis]
MQLLLVNVLKDGNDQLVQLPATSVFISHFPRWLRESWFSKIENLYIATSCTDSKELLIDME